MECHVDLLLSASIVPHPAISNSCDLGTSAVSVRIQAGRTMSLNSTAPINSINAMSFFFR